ncbi:MAG: MogA/MoaB family molybdenum cofactor biosynthesis protein [Clostridium sp.]|uniref:MogA/MoaB family molybdenum cofactor biosynthesis protein n=1 Tax=Clostridium sp. TaxID=1506 RepID=UPI002FC88ED1
MNAAIITVSDKGSRGERVDTAGPAIKELLKTINCTVEEYIIVPDERDIIANTIKDMASKDINLIFTTGGTGFSKRDVTPEATLDVIEREIPGIPEAMRYNSMKITPKGMLSRSRAGIINNSIVINLPGSEKAVRENLETILPVLGHGVSILLGTKTECGVPYKK